MDLDIFSKKNLKTGLKNKGIILIIFLFLILFSGVFILNSSDLFRKIVANMSRQLLGLIVSDSGEQANFISDLDIGKEGVDYVAGEVLVKFKEDADPQSVLNKVKLKTDDLTRIHSIKPAVEKVRNQLKRKVELKGGDYLLGGEVYTKAEAIPEEKLFKEAEKTMSLAEKELYRIYKIKLSKDKNVKETILELNRNSKVEYAEPNGIARVFMVPNDPYFHSEGSWGQNHDDLWGLKRLRADFAWELNQGEGVVVAVVDTGVALDHEDLADNIWINNDEIAGNGIDDDGNGYVDDVNGWDFSENDNIPNDAYGHGSHVAGTIAGVGNNNKGVIGIAPKAKIMAVRFLDEKGSGTYEAAVQAVKYAVDNGANITNNSWGGSLNSDALKDVFNYGYSKNVLSIAAAGNGASEPVFYPAFYESVIAVSASTQRDELTYFSSYGKEVEVAAPGGGYKGGEYGGREVSYNILSTALDSSYIGTNYSWTRVSPGYYRLAGTSMAAPHVSGLAAILYSYYPDLTNSEIRDLIRYSADDVGEEGRDKYFGYGIARILFQSATFLFFVEYFIGS